MHMRHSTRSPGWYHVSGAVAGSAFTLWAWAHGASLFGNSLETAALPFALSFTSGIRLLRGSSRARQLAYLTQSLQIPIVMLPALTWRFSAGVDASLTVTARGLFAFGGVDVGWLAGRGNLGSLTPTLGINFAPILMLVLLARSVAPLTPANAEPCSKTSS
jgi:hypothetical protein